MALSFCAASGVQPSLLIHPLDLLTADDAPELKFFPGMSLSLRDKLYFLDWVLATLTDSYEVVDMKRHALNVLESRKPN
jgi:hypothetical protein